MSSPSSSSSPSVLFEENCNYEKVEGVFRVYRTELEWRSFHFLRNAHMHTTQPTQVTIPLKDLQQVLVSKHGPKILFHVKKNGGRMKYMFEFENETIRQQCDLLVKRVFNDLREKTIPLQVKQKLRILGSDPQLMKMYKELVEGGIVTEREFWESRKQLLINETTKADYQQSGVQSDMFAELKKKLSGEGKGGEKKRVLLDTATIRDIYVAYPNVKKAFELNVPHKVSEQQFWQRFLQSQHFYRDREGGTTHVSTTMRKSAQQDEMFDKYCDMDDETIQKRYYEQTDTMDKFVNISTNDYRLQNLGYGAKQDEMTAPTRVGGASDLLRRYNSDSARVLEGPYSVQHASAARNEANMTEEERLFANHRVLEDLAPYRRTEEQLMPLDIQDKQRYFENYSVEQETATVMSKPKSMIVDYNETELLDAFDEEIAHLKFDSNSAVVDGTLAFEISRDIDRRSMLANGSLPMSIAKDSREQNATQEFREKLENYFHLLNELLRHFWSCTLGPREMHKKADKIMNALQDLEKKIIVFQTEYNNDTDLSGVIKTLLQAISTARTRHESHAMTGRTPTTPSASAAGMAAQRTPSVNFSGFSLSKSATPPATAGSKSAAATTSSSTSAHPAASQQSLSFNLNGTSKSNKRNAATKMKQPTISRTEATTNITPSIFGDDDDDA